MSEGQRAELDKIIQRKVLANGLEVIVVENHGVPLATIEIDVKNGSFTQSPEYEGLAHMYEHMFFRANSTYPEPNQFWDRASDLGAVFNGTTAEERVNYYMTVPAEKLDGGNSPSGHRPARAAFQAGRTGTRASGRDRGIRQKRVEPVLRSIERHGCKALSRQLQQEGHHRRPADHPDDYAGEDANDSEEVLRSEQLGSDRCRRREPRHGVRSRGEGARGVESGRRSVHRGSDSGYSLPSEE